MNTWYYYLHENGSLIGKNPAVVDNDPQYWDSSFVRKAWLINKNNRADAWNLILDAVELNASLEDIQRLIDTWGITEEDGKRFTEITGTRIIFDVGIPHRENKVY